MEKDEQKLLDEIESETTTIWDILCTRDSIGIWMPKFKLKHIEYKNETILEVGTFSNDQNNIFTHSFCYMLTAKYIYE